MENAADALKMAAAALIFIIAIASSFSLFGTAKQTADSIIGMRDKQQYLQAAELDTVLYTSSDKIQTGGISGYTTNGDRIVKVDDVVSTIYRYSKEKYGVTIVESSGTILKRYDSNTENIMRQYNNINNPDGLKAYINQLKENTQNNYATPKFTQSSLEKIYAIHATGNSNIKCGAPWYGSDKEIRRRINADIAGEEYTYNNQTYNYGTNQVNLFNKLTKARRIVEVTNEIDQSQYLKDNGQETSLLQQYQMPTVEVIYIIQN